MIEYINEKDPIVQRMREFRQDIHAHPELAYEEKKNG